MSRYIRKSRSPVAPACETLENRLLFIAYNVDGTSGPDTISISISGNSIISVVNGVSDSGSDIINNEIEINALGGNDIISIIETGANTVTINGGAGDDTINIGNGNNDLDFIDDFITVNGEGNTDTVVLFNQSDTSGSAFTVSSGNQYARGGVPVVTANVENVVIHASSTVGQNLNLDDPQSADVVFNGGPGAAFNTILLDGLGSRSGSYRPDGAVLRSGSLSFSTSTIDFTNSDQVSFNDFATATLTPQNANDVVTIAPSGNSAAGSSGGFPWTPMVVDSTSTWLLDLAAHDAGAGNDTITGSGGHAGATTLLVNAGTGTNTLNANGGNWNVSTSIGIGGVNLDVIVNSASLTFAGTQSVRRIELNGGTASLTGNPVTLTTQQLAVVSGNGTLNVGTSNTVNVPAGGSMSIGAGRILDKSGLGTLTVNAAQSHGAGAQFINNSGVTNFNTNAGSAAARGLGVFADAGTINLNSTQHVTSVGTNFGNINVGANGSRVVVTGSVDIGGEAGAINLNDNDMIIDYTGATQLENTRLILHNGYAGGSWNGIGLRSASAAASGITGLGYAEATDLFTTFPATFAGQPIDNTSILVKYTFYGDQNFDGDTDLDDFNILATNFGTNNKRWIGGDFSYDLLVNLDDFNHLASAFGQSGLGAGARTSALADAKSVEHDLAELA